MRRSLWILAVIFGLVASPLGAQEARFSLHLDAIPLTPRDARTQARLARWNTPMGRLQHQVSELQANAGWSGLVGGAPRALVFRVKAQGGLPLHLVSSVTMAGVELHEEDIIPIHWPWEKKKHPKHKVLSMDQQISKLLGSRLHP